MAIKAELIAHEKAICDDGKHAYEVKAWRFPQSEKFPQGVKLSCCLWELETGVRKIILDNHEPFGFHIHPVPQTNKELREPIEVQDYVGAIEYFQARVQEVLHEMQ